MIQKNAPPNYRQAELIRRRGLDPKEYTVVRVLNYSLWIRHRKTGVIKIIDKRS